MLRYGCDVSIPKTMKHFDPEDQFLSIDATIEQIEFLQKTINDLSIYTRRLDRYPFDTVAGEIVAKAFALSRSAILLAQNGFPDEAFGMCRSLYESAIYLRYITQDPSERDIRSRAFLDFGVTSKAFWFEMLSKSSITQEEREEAERYKAENEIPDDPKRVTQPWSGVRRLVERISKEPHPSDLDDSTQDLREKEKAIGYTDTSSYVHCTQPGLNSYTYRWKEPILLPRSSRANSSAQKTCMLIRVHLVEIIRYSLFGMGLSPTSNPKAEPAS
jgi:Family of unknown function (DUF5677)